VARGFFYAEGADLSVASAATAVMSFDELARLSRSKNSLVRQTIAARQDCPLAIMALLAKDKVPSVRAAVAANPVARESVLDLLRNDKSAEVLDALAAKALDPGAMATEFVPVDQGPGVTTATRTAPIRGFRPPAGWSASEVLERASGVDAVPTGSARASTRTAPVRGFKAP
jgi:hypothetical protein